MDASPFKSKSFQSFLFTNSIVSLVQYPKFIIINSKKIAKWTVISRSFAKKPAFDYRILFTSALNLSREYKIRNPLNSLRKASENIHALYKAKFERLSQ